MRRLLTLVQTTFISIGCILAQQPTQFSLFRYNQFSINPAYAGKDGSLSGNIGIRQQWNGLVGAPQTQILNIHAPFNYIKSAVGINLESDKVGLQQSVQIAAAYCYDFSLNKNATLSLGLRAGILQASWNGTQIRTPDGNYQPNVINHKDNILGENTFNGSSPIVEAGVLFHNNIIDIGVGIKNLTQNSINNTINNGKIRLVKNYFFTFAADLPIANKIKLQPALLFKSDLIENQLDMNLCSEFREKITVGAGYRGWSKTSNDALNLIGGIRLNAKLRLFYSYDINISSLKNTNNGSHEVLLKYILDKPIGKGIPERIIYNPRYY